jgi:hypothetical protein
MNLIEPIVLTGLLGGAVAGGIVGAKWGLASGLGWMAVGIAGGVVLGSLCALVVLCLLGFVLAGVVRLTEKPKPGDRR